MRILVLGGAGAMGTVTVRDLAESLDVSQIVIGDVSVEKANCVKNAIVSKKITVRHLDVSNQTDTVEAMKEADAVANALPYQFNIQAMEAAMKAGVSLADLGGVYHTTLEQLKLDEEVKKTGITILLGGGLAPGIAEVLAKYGADQLDFVDKVHLIHGEHNFSPARYKWSFRTILEEFTAGPVVFQNGKYKKLPPFSGRQIVEFPDPIGKKTCCYGLASAVATLPQTIGKGVKAVAGLTSYTEEDKQRIKVLNEMGLTRHKPIDFQNIKVSPREFLLRCAPPPDVKAKDVASAIVEVTGEKRSEKVRCKYSVTCHFHEKYGVSAMAYLTGAPLSIVSQLLAKGEISGSGALPPEEAIPPKPFFAELATRGIEINESVETKRVL